MGIFFWLFVVLAVLWLIFWLGMHIAGGFIHLLIILAVIALVIHFVRGSRAAV